MGSVRCQPLSLPSNVLHIEGRLTPHHAPLPTIANGLHTLSLSKAEMTQKVLFGFSVRPLRPAQRPGCAFRHGHLTLEELVFKHLREALYSRRDPERRLPCWGLHARRPISYSLPSFPVSGPALGDRAKLPQQLQEASKISTRPRPSSISQSLRRGFCEER